MSKRYETADKVRITIEAVIRPNYAGVETIRQEIEESIDFYSGNHNVFADGWTIEAEVVGEAEWDYGPEDGEDA